MTTSTDLARTGTVTDEFDHAAAAYDRLVAAHPGYHRDLRTSVRRLALPGPGTGLRLLDLGCGTGASTTALLDAFPTARIVGVDASPGCWRWPRPSSGRAMSPFTGPVRRR